MNSRSLQATVIENEPATMNELSIATISIIHREIVFLNVLKFKLRT
jgi:hypothetical protein